MKYFYMNYYSRSGYGIKSAFANFYANDRVESQGILVVVHFDIALILADSFLNAFYAKTMPMLIGFVGGQAALWI